jgi:hypothetical protein
MFTQRDVGWWCWLVAMPLAAGAALGCRWSLVAAMALALVQATRIALRAYRGVVGAPGGGFLKPACTVPDV